MRISQNPIELENMKQYIQDFGVTSILEIGSRYGETLLEIAKVLPKHSRIVSIDLPNGPWGRADSKATLINNLESLIENYDVHLFLGSSQEEHIIKEVRKLGPYDFIFIDGDHSLSGVTADWVNYNQMGKHIGFHDINTRLDVPVLWRELKKRYHYTEFIANHPPEMGIGIVQVQQI